MNPTQHATISAYQRVGLAFWPNMVWEDDILTDRKGTVGAEVNDYLLTVFHGNGNRSHYAVDLAGNLHCHSLHVEDS